MDDSPVASDTPAGDITIEVEEPQAGQRLDKFLAGQDLDLSRSRIRKLIEEDFIRIRNRPHITPSLKVKAGDVVLIRVPPPKSVSIRPARLDLSVVYEDACLLVVDKPAGLVVHPGAGHREGTLVHGLLYHCGDLSGIGGELRPGIVHRLDKDTSGLMVVAKDDAAHRALAAQFKEGRVRKNYLALVIGHMRAITGKTDLPVGRHPVDRKKMSTRSRRGKSALTIWRVLEEFPGAALLSLEIGTGRTHQIRVHMSSIGHPLLGDTVYGGPKSLRIRKTTIHVPRQMLHASRLGLDHPVTGERMEWKSPIPPDMDAVIEELRGLVREA